MPVFWRIYDGVAMRDTHVGVLVCDERGWPPFADGDFYRELACAGEKLGMTVFVFAPAWVSWKSLKTWGFVFDRKRGEWMKQALPLPSLVYDRCFCKSRRQLVQKRQFMQNVRHRPAIRMLGNGVSHKWATQQILQRYSEFRPFLPETALYRTPDSLERWLVRHGNAFLKPLSGCHGKGVLHMIRTSGGAIHVRGRDAANRPLRFVAKDARSLAARIDPLVQRRKYLMQPAFTLQTKSGIPFDVRALVQKNRRGVWRTTGIAIRLGRPGSVTANLHGGGVALAAEPFLQREFGEATSSRLLELIRRLCASIPPCLEQYYGRMAELGLDFGIDQRANLWILEVNSKPGRAAFSRQQAIRDVAVQQPLSYAKYLLERP